MRTLPELWNIPVLDLLIVVIIFAALTAVIRIVELMIYYVRKIEGEITMVYQGGPRTISFVEIETNGQRRHIHTPGFVYFQPGDQVLKPAFTLNLHLNEELQQGPQWGAIYLLFHILFPALATLWLFKFLEHAMWPILIALCMAAGFKSWFPRDFRSRN